MPQKILVQCRTCQWVGSPIRTLEEAFCEECHSWDVEPYSPCKCCLKAEAEAGSDFCTPCADVLDSTCPRRLGWLARFGWPHEPLPSPDSRHAGHRHGGHRPPRHPYLDRLGDCPGGWLTVWSTR